MSRYPGADWRPVKDTGTDPAIIPVGVILHVSASMAPSLFGYFDGPSKGVESHLHIPLTARNPIEQYRDTHQEADANYKGNSWTSGGKRYGFLSVETQGLADGEWTAYQLDEIERFIRWAAHRHGFPLELAKSYRSPGIGWHVMWGAGANTASWSNARGKVCPGPRRIAQIHDVLMPRLTRPLAPSPTGARMFITNAKDDPRQWLIQNGGGSHIPDQKTSEELRAGGVPWVRDADPAWVESVIKGGTPS